MSLTAQELHDAIDAHPRYTGRVHWATGVHFAGTPGHLYVFARSRRITSAQLAVLSHLAGNIEVCHMRMESTPVLYFGSRGVAAATLFVPLNDTGIESYEWVAHTHPREMASDREGVADGPTEADHTALEDVYRRWRQTRSIVVVCRGGRVLREVPFMIERDSSTVPGTGHLWHPTD